MENGVKDGKQALVVEPAEVIPRVTTKVPKTKTVSEQDKKAMTSRSKTIPISKAGL